MTTSEFRRNAAAFFNAVEKGEKILITRHGKPIATVIPTVESKVAFSWKRPGLGLQIDGVSLSREILRERKKARLG
ncbi:MAG: type II toxin-antitoxin system prevent-host-death family antitoxin [Acidobacteriota bacterium]